MFLVRRINFLICVLFICSFISSTPIPEKENEKQKEEPSDSTEEESNEKDNETLSPIELENVKENKEENAEMPELFSTSKPEEVETYEKEKEQPENVDDKFKNFLALFHKIESKSSEIEEVRKSSHEMKERKEESYKLINELNKKLGQPEISHEEFNEMWNNKKKKWGKKFPGIVEKFSVLLKETVEETDFTTEETTTVEISEAVTATSTVHEDATKEESPTGVFAVRNEKEKICIIAKFQSSITITYSGKSSEQKVEVTIPQSGHVKGNCRDPNGSSLLQITWGKFIFSLFFNETTEDTWAVTLVELTYDTSEALFDGAAERKNVTVKSKKVNLFETPYGKSYFCPAQEVILLYRKDQHVATVRLKEIHLQAYDVEDGKFSTTHRCNQVVIGGAEEEAFVQDETVPLAVGCTLALITLLILVGFSVHRAYNAAKVDYNTVE